MGRKEPFYADIMATHPEVTGSCILVIVKFPNERTLRFVVDCGLFHEKQYADYNNSLPFKPENIDFCLVTHNHVDHTGRLPLMVKKGFYKNIYATEATCKLLPLALFDSYKVLEDVARRKNAKVLYTETDVSNTISHLKPCKFDEEIDICEGVKVQFFNNGHLIGAASILVKISYPGFNDINIFFTGDYNNKNMFFKVNPIPDDVLELPITIIQESTYGKMNSTDIVKNFKENLLYCVSNGGTLLAPVFSLGRSQEILYELKKMQLQKELSTDIPIYLDGKLALKYTRLYLKEELGIDPEMKDFLPENLTEVDKTFRPKVIADANCKIILTTSGMASYGPAQVYIPEYIARKNAMIHFTGYTAEGTLGAKLKFAEIGESIEINGLISRKRAIVEYTTEYSAHAKADEMIDFLKQFKRPQLILVNHGESDTKREFALRIADEINPKRVGILDRQYFFRINPYGLVKTFSTSFE